MSPSANATEYRSTEWHESATLPGVRFEVKRISIGRRLEITGQVRQLLAELEYHAGGEELKDRLNAAWVGTKIDQTYIEWGLASIEGLMVDGKPATIESLLQHGPEELSREIAACIRRQCHLSGPERKN